MQVCLHFDINKTVILSDTSSGKSLLPSINALLSECTWGYFCESIPTEERTASDWHPFTHFSPSAAPPESAYLAREEAFDNANCQITTFGAFLEEHTSLPRSQQKALKFAFLEQPQGLHAQPQYEALLQTLSLSAEEKERVQSLHNQLRSEGDDGCAYLLSGYFHILPSFFYLLEYIADQYYTHPHNRVNNNTSEATVTQEAQISEFRLVFRSFGTDIKNVAHELNLYCAGRHPLFRSKYPLDGSIYNGESADIDKEEEGEIVRKALDFRLKLPHNSASFLRTGAGPEDLHLAHVSEEELVVVNSNASQIFDYLLYDWLQFPPHNGCRVACRRATFSHSVVIRDHYAYWSSQRESDNSGKVLLVDPQGSVLQVFFDDNIERDRAHIVDVRDKNTFSPIPFEQSNNYLIHRVEPLLAITQREYFVQMLEKSLARHKQPWC